MNLGDSFTSGIKKKLFEVSLSKGDVFVADFPGIDHPKLFIIVGLSEDKVFTCSVYINSEIHPSLKNKPALFWLQKPLKKLDNDFLHHDSFACCSTPIIMKSSIIFEKRQNENCRLLGKINDLDLLAITSAVKDSGLLSEDEIELYQL